MSEATSFWQRLGRYFNKTASDGQEHAAADSASRVQVRPMPGAAPPAPLVEMRPAGGFFARLRRTDSRAAQLAAYQRMTELMDTLQSHYRRQDEHAARVEQQTERMTEVLHQLAETGRNQQEQVRSIAEGVSVAGRQTAAMSESLSLLPPLLQAEADAVRSMVRQMDVAQESDTQLMHSLQKLGQAVEALNAAGAAQAQTLERLSAAEREQRQALATLVHEQTRRFYRIMLVAAIMGVGALATLAWLLIVFFHR